MSAHWETAVPTVTSGQRPGLIYDYYNFPKEAYEVNARVLVPNCGNLNSKYVRVKVVVKAALMLIEHAMCRSSTMRLGSQLLRAASCSCSGAL